MVFALEIKSSFNNVQINNIEYIPTTANDVININRALGAYKKSVGSTLLFDEFVENLDEGLIKTKTTGLLASVKDYDFAKFINFKVAIKPNHEIGIFVDRDGYFCSSISSDKKFSLQELSDMISYFTSILRQVHRPILSSFQRNLIDLIFPKERTSRYMVIIEKRRDNENSVEQMVDKFFYDYVSLIEWPQNWFSLKNMQIIIGSRGIIFSSSNPKDIEKYEKIINFFSFLMSFKIFQMKLQNFIEKIRREIVEYQENLSRKELLSNNENLVDDIILDELEKLRYNSSLIALRISQIRTIYYDMDQTITAKKEDFKLFIDNIEDKEELYRLVEKTRLEDTFSDIETMHEELGFLCEDLEKSSKQLSDIIGILSSYITTKQTIEIQQGIIESENRGLLLQKFAQIVTTVFIFFSFIQFWKILFPDEFKNTNIWVSILIGLLFAILSVFITYLSLTILSKKR